jgi:hypothetical protein
MLESTPLLSHPFPTINIKKGKCWCCWEFSETPDDPLIRVCRGCKDPDLQYIHQDCINQYISNLPNPSHSSLDSENQFYCTRCKDPYLVVSQPIHPLLALRSEKVLFPSMMVITSCILSLTFFCVSLICESLSTGINFQFLNVPLWLIATLMLGFCHVVNLLTWILVLKHCSGRYKRIVLSIPETFLLQTGSSHQNQA